MESSVKIRLNKFLKHLGIGQAKFAEYVGVSRGFANNVGDSIRADNLAKISAAYPELNIAWLQTGVGNMLNETADTPASSHRIRYWVDVDATAGGVTQFDDMMSSQYIDLAIPEFRDCTDAVNLYGDSMLPLYKSGQIIILKEWKESFIDYGNVYLVVTKKGNRMVKYLRKGSDADHVLCVSENKEFDSFEILVDDILRLYLVKGGISKNTL